MAGYVKLFRSIENWEWYTDVNTTKLFLHCLIKASRNDYRWKGIDLKKGQFPTSYEKLAKENGLSISQIRTSLKKLILTGELTRIVTDDKTIINVKNWALYQDNDGSDDMDDDSDVDSSIAEQSQSDDSSIATTKKYKKERKKEEDKDIGAFESFSSKFPQYKDALRDYKSMRVMMKKKMTPRAELTFINRLESFIAKGHDGLTMLDEAISKNWLSIYEPKSYGKEKSDRQDTMPTNTFSKGGYEVVD